MKVPSGYKKNVPKFLKELTKLTLKYGIIVDAAWAAWEEDGNPCIYLNSYATSKTLAGPITFYDDKYG